MEDRRGSNEAVAGTSHASSSEVSQEEVDSLLDSLGQPGAGDEKKNDRSGRPILEKPGSNQRIQVKVPVMANIITRFGLKVVLATKSTAVSDTLRSTGHVFTTEPTVTSQADITRAMDDKKEPSKRMENLAQMRLRRLIAKFPRRGKLLLVTTAQLIKNAHGVEKLPDDPVDMEWLASLSQSSVKTYTVVIITNLGTGHTVFGCDETTVHFRKISDSAAHRSLQASMPLVPIDHPELSKYVASVEGTSDSVRGFPVALFNSLITDVLRISASEMIARENSLKLEEVLPGWGCIRASFMILCGMFTCWLLYLLWVFNAENGAALSPLSLLTTQGFSAVAYHAASGAIEERLADTKHTLFKHLRGRVVELGAGSGANLDWYRQEGIEEVVLVEPSAVLCAALSQKLQLNGMRAQVLEQEAEDVELAPGSVDVVVATLALNCVTDTQLVLNLVYEWLKPGGKLIVIEITDSPYRDQLHFTAVQALTERVATLLWDTISGGCHFGHDTLTRLQTLKGSRFKQRSDIMLPVVGIPVVAAVVERIV